MTSRDGLASLIDRTRAAGGGRGPAPVERWDPPFCGDLDLVIRADGTWLYMGTPIGREPLVRLFASVLRKDADGETYLVTPVEKIRIRVEDAPFRAVDAEIAGEGRDQMLHVVTNMGDAVAVGPDHPLRFVTEAGTGGLKPYVRVRGRLDALFTRAATHRLLEAVAIETVDGVPHAGLWSGGAFFPAIPAADLEGLS